MKNFIISGLIVILLVAVGYIVYQQGYNKALDNKIAVDKNSENISKIESKEVNNENNQEQIIGGDKDEHGCLAGAGYSWCEEKQKCLRVWEEECIASPKEKIAEALAEKYEKNLNETTISIKYEEENYVRGGVEFAPGGPGNSGMFLAVKLDNGEWKIVYDGNGAPDCVALKGQYKIPSTFLSGICD